MARPFDCFEPSGTSNILIQKHLPCCVKINSQLWFVAVKMFSRKSSCLVEDPLAPTPPLVWDLYSFKRVRLMYPAWLIVMTTCSSGIMSSILTSALLNSIVERRSSPNLSRISASSSLIIVMRRSLRSRMSFKSVIMLINSSNSALSLSRSRPVSFCNLISKIARA